MSGNKLVELLNQYSDQHTILETGKQLGIKPITTGQMKAILKYEGEEDATLVDKILDDIVVGCVTTPDFNIDDLTLQDRFELLIGIRKVSKGSIYNFNIKCPKCGVESIQAINLDELEVIPFPKDIDRKIVINNNLFVYMDFIRRGHQKQSVDIVESMDGLTDNQKRSEIITFMYAFGMTKFETKVGEIKDITIENKKEFLDNLGAKYYDIINGWYEKYTYGTKFKYTAMCKAGTCGWKKEENIPITGFFF
jgi:hypothetical protein